MTTLSLMEKPMMVSTAATTVALNWRPGNGVGDAITADGQEHVVDHADDGADGEGKFVAERDINQDAEHRQQAGDDGRLLDFRCPRSRRPAGCR